MVNQLDEKTLLLTLMVNVAVSAILATMLVRFQRFRQILLTERRDWPERLVFAAAFLAATLYENATSPFLRSGDSSFGRNERT